MQRFVDYSCQNVLGHLRLRSCKWTVVGRIECLLVRTRQIENNEDALCVSIDVH